MTVKYISYLRFPISLLFLYLPSLWAADTARDALALRPIVQSPINLNLPTEVFNTPNSIDEIFKVLRTLEFTPVPGVSLIAKDNIVEGQINNSSEITSRSEKNTNQRESSNIQRRNNSSKITPTPQGLSQSKNSKQITLLKDENESLKKELISLKETNNQLNNQLLTTSESASFGLNVIASNLLDKFSQEKMRQNQEQLTAIENELAQAKEKIAAFESEINSLNELPKEGDEKLIRQINVLKKSLADERVKAEQTEILLSKELNNKNDLLANVQRELEQLKITQERNQNVTNDLSSKLALSQGPLEAKIDDLTSENAVLKKAYNEEKLRAQSTIATLENSNKALQAQLLGLEQNQKNESQNQTLQLLELQSRVQQTELNRQKLEQQLALAEQKSIQLQAELEKLTAENLKNNQNYQLQLADLQQRLLNARRSEQEANRWARAAGVGNTNAANTRILNLQQQIDTISASEEKQRSIALFNQQQVNTLQSQLATLKAELKSQQQSKAQLEKQIVSLEKQSKQPESDDKAATPKNTSKENSQRKQEKSNNNLSLNEQLKESSQNLSKENKKAILSTDAGMQKL